jgi:hypothetical protein
VNRKLAETKQAETSRIAMTIHKTFSLFLSLFLSFFLLVWQPLSALACSTCGCSELCPIAMMKDSEESKSAASLSDSLWGNIILKMAYQKDPEIQKLSKHVKGVNALTGGTIAGAVGGTLAQNIVSAATLNPPDGQQDSYLPGSLGLGLSGLINIAFDGGMLINWRLKKKMKARQLVVRQNVETILNHLEYSETACPQAQAELSKIIGNRAAGDCIQLWRSSHATAYAAREKNLSVVPVLSPALSPAL